MAKKQNLETAFIRKIVVATDFSPPSNRAFAIAIQLASRLDAEVVSVFVKDADDLAIALRQNIPVHRREFDKLKEKVDTVINTNFQSLLKDSNTDRPIRFLILIGNPADEILKVAKKEKAGLIVTGTRSRSLVSSMLLGSTARELILRSECPVITLNLKDRR